MKLPIVKLLLFIVPIVVAGILWKRQSSPFSVDSGVANTQPVLVPPRESGEPMPSMPTESSQSPAKGIESLREPQPLVSLLHRPGENLAAALAELLPEISDGNHAPECLAYFEAKNFETANVVGFLDGDELVTVMTPVAPLESCALTGRVPLERARHLLRDELF